MKKYIFILFLPLFLSCQKYSVVSEPAIAGEWKFTDYYITVRSSISEVKIRYTDTICINNFALQQKMDSFYVLRQDFRNTSVDRRFIRNRTTWLFDGPSQSTFFPLIIDKTPHNIYASTPRPYLRNEYVDLVVSNENIGSNTTYMFMTDAVGQNYSKKLTLTSPLITTDLYTSLGMRDKAISVVITLIFTRN